jgi:hypothetical protein
MTHSSGRSEAIMNVHFNRAPSGMDLGALEVFVQLETITITDTSEGGHIVIDLDEARSLLALLKIVVPPDDTEVKP